LYPEGLAREPIGNALDYTPVGYSSRTDDPDPTEGEHVETRIYSVADMSCAHCERAVSSELHEVSGVESVEVDLDKKLVTVCGVSLDDSVLHAAIEEPGYQAA
jgi:copper chaperone